MVYHNYSNDELVRELEVEYSDCQLIKELIARFEDGCNNESIDGVTDNDYREKCVDHMQEIAGEDHHQEIMDDISELEHIKTMKDRKKHISYINGKLSDMDTEALNLIEVVKSDGMFL